MSKTNYFAVAACALVNMMLGMVWYGMLFAQQWMDGNKLTEDVVESMPNGALPYVISVVGALITGFVLSLIFHRMNVTGWLDGLQSGAAIGLFGLVGTFTNNAFSLRPMALSWIDGGYVFVLFCLYGLVIGGWQRK